MLFRSLQMPIMDGYKATRQIRIFDQDTPIIALTASALLKVRQDVIAAGMNDYITKQIGRASCRERV